MQVTEEQFRTTGRDTGGVRAIEVAEGDRLVSMAWVRPGGGGTEGAGTGTGPDGGVERPGPRRREGPAGRRPPPGRSGRGPDRRGPREPRAGRRDGEGPGSARRPRRRTPVEPGPRPPPPGGEPGVPERRGAGPPREAGPRRRARRTRGAGEEATALESGEGHVAPERLHAVARRRPPARRPALLGAFLLLPRSSPAAGETKTFEAQNFKITLPSDTWQWAELNSESRRAATWAIAARQATGTSGPRPPPGPAPGEPTLSIDEADPGGEGGLSTSLVAGLEGSRIGQGEALGARRAPSSSQGEEPAGPAPADPGLHDPRRGPLPPDDLLLVNGAETKQAAEVEAIRRGYRLLQGAGPEEPAGPDSAGRRGARRRGAGRRAPAGPGSRRPKQEGHTLTFPAWNLKWTTPAGGSPFGWAAVTDNEDAAEGTLARWRPAIERAGPGEARGPTREGEADEGPPGQHGDGSSNVGGIEPGWTPQALVNIDAVPGEHRAERVRQAWTTAAPRWSRSWRSGTSQAPPSRWSGRRRRGGPASSGIYAVGLKGKRYTWECMFEGDGSVDDDFGKPLAGAHRRSVEFLDTTIWVRGPLGVPGVPSADQERGSGTGRRRKSPPSGSRPRSPRRWTTSTSTPRGGREPPLRLGDPDRRTSRPTSTSTSRPGPKRSLQGQKSYAEDMIKQREALWKEDAKSPTTVTKGKEPLFKTGLREGEGARLRVPGLPRGRSPTSSRASWSRSRTTCTGSGSSTAGRTRRRPSPRPVKAVGKAPEDSGSSDRCRPSEPRENDTCRTTTGSSSPDMAAGRSPSPRPPLLLPLLLRPPSSSSPSSPSSPGTRRGGRDRGPGERTTSSRPPKGGSALPAPRGGTSWGSWPAPPPAREAEEREAGRRGGGLVHLSVTPAPAREGAGRPRRGPRGQGLPPQPLRGGPRRVAGGGRGLRQASGAASRCAPRAEGDRQPEGAARARTRAVMS